MVRTDIHADDYALTLQTSQDMLSCMQKGQLDSISIVPNMSCFEACMELLYAAVPKLPFLPLMSVHLDFVEGRCLAGASSVPLLAADGGRSGQEGLIGLSWGGVFVLSALEAQGSQRTVEKGDQGADRRGMDGNEAGNGCCRRAWSCM